ncbi:phosphonate ABC transporter ATP-binding protein, partial [Escherichia coli]|nr:phosphonate ABC transporter ATP-binding protein [Escherichia coli]
MNSSLAAVAETEFQPFTPPYTDRQRKVLSVRNLSKSWNAQQTVLD